MDLLLDAGQLYLGRGIDHPPRLQKAGGDRHREPDRQENHRAEEHPIGKAQEEHDRVGEAEGGSGR